MSNVLTDEARQPPCDSFALDAIVQANGLCHTFGAGAAAVRVLHHVDLQLHRGQLVMLMGPSGGGKTTLLSLIGCLRSVREGSVKLLGQELNGASLPTLMQMRRHAGFIFQDHHLHESLTAIQNVRMGLEVHGPAAMADWRLAAERVLGLVGLSERANFLPAELSGGQKQRVAVARALVGNPEIVLADEPTAALDKESGIGVAQLLRRLADNRNATVLMVTHDHRILEYADRIIKIVDGRIEHDGL